MADDNTSVGKISLVIDLTQDLEKEIGSAANLIADGLQSQLSRSKFKVNADTTEVKKSIENLPTTMNNAMNSTKSVVQAATQAMKNSIENNVNRTIQNSIAQLSRFSLPSPQKSLGGSTPNLDVAQAPVAEISKPTNFIDADFTDVSNKAMAVLDQIESKTEETASKTKESFSQTSNSVKGNVDETVADAERKTSSFISSLSARLRNIKMPSFDFSNIKLPKFNFESPKTPEPVLGTETQRLQMDLLIRQMDVFSGKADEARAHVRELQVQIGELSKPTGSPILDFINTSQIDKLKEDLKAAELEEQKFGDKSDSIGIRIANLEDKMKSAAIATNNNTKAVHGKGDSLDSTGKKGTLFGSIFSRLAGTMKTSENACRSSRSEFDRMGFSLEHITRMLGMMLIYTTFFNTVIRGLGAMATYIGSTFMANEQFRASILQTRSNLMTAFQPIYNSILPALNALARGLATVTAYIASFMSQLFGTTYQASFAGASALQNQIGSMNIAEKQAKKTANSLGSVSDSAKKAADGINEAAKASKKGLASFDEINQLSEPAKAKAEKTPGDGVVDPITPMANMSPIENAMQGFADKIKKVLAGLWTPFKQAWASEGLNTINAAKYALSGIENLIGSIARSFYTVWTNGTGEKILVNFLKILQDMFNIIGDIGNTFADAWNKGGIGTQIVQSLANALNNVLSLIDKMLKSVRTVWGEEGPKFANMFMQALKATSGVIENLTEKLGWIWDHGGQHAFEGIVRLGLKISELALFIYTNFVTPFVNWFVNMISPAIAKVLDIVGSLADVFSIAIDKIMTLLTNFKTSIDSIVTKIEGFKGAIQAIGIILGALGLALLVYNAKAIIATISTSALSLATGGWSAVSGIATAATTALGVAINFLTSPITIVILAIGALIAIGVLLYQNWDQVSVFLTNAWNTIKDTALIVWTSIGNFFQTLWASISNNIMFVWNTIKGFFSILWNDIKAGIEIVWNGIKTYFDNLWTGINTSATTVWNKLKTFLSTLWNGLKTTASDVISGIKDTFSGLTDFISGTFTGNWDKAWNGVKSIFKGVFDSLYGIVKAPLNLIIDAINAVIRGLNTLHIDIPDWVSKITGISGSWGINIPQIPKLARGGIIDQPTLAMVGEAGKEAVVPLENTEFVDTLASAVANAILAVMQFNKGNNQNSQDIRDIILQLDGTTIARILQPYLYKENQRIGNRLIIKTT